MPLTRLRPAPWNPRFISSERFENLCASIEADPDFLWRRPVLAQADGTIYAGMMRFHAAAHLGYAAIPAIVEDVPDRVARERALRDNQQWGDWDESALLELLQSLRDEGSDVSLLGFDDRELDDLLYESPAAAADPDEVPPLPRSPVSRPGDLWQLGPHRLFCGDSADDTTLPRLMAGEAVELLWTDPPYGVSYSGRTKEALRIENDDAGGIAALLARSLPNVDRVLRPGAAFYLTHPAGALAVTFATAVLHVGWHLHQGLVWVKDSLVLGHSDYHYRHEPILYGWKPGDERMWLGGRQQDSVFEVPRPAASPDHPTCKPVALVEQHIRNSSRRGAIVLDPFVGSGTTLIAAERLGRRCRAVEIDPRYVDVAVERWQQATGGKAVRRG